MSKRSQSLSNSPSGDKAGPMTFNPISKWQEYEEFPGLTLFDIHRAPRREDLDTDAVVTIKLKMCVCNEDAFVGCLISSHLTTIKKTLAPEFQCPVCLGYIKTTRIVKECLHRFCNECIEKCLRSGMKHCPQCRMYIPSRRSLRYAILLEQVQIFCWSNAMANLILSMCVQYKTGH